MIYDLRKIIYGVWIGKKMIILPLIYTYRKFTFENDTYYITYILFLRNGFLNGMLLKVAKLLIYNEKLTLTYIFLFKGGYTLSRCAACAH